MKDIEQKKFNRFIKLGIENHIDIKIQANLSHEVLCKRSIKGINHFDNISKSIPL